MDRTWRLRRAALWLILLVLSLPAAALAQGVLLQPGEAARQACETAGGTLLAEPYSVFVASPYGTQSVVLRSAPADSYDAVAMLMVGQEITAAGECEPFVFVLVDGQIYGWLASDELEQLK